MTEPFSKPRNHALIDAGVTSRQAQHWQSAGLFQPQFAGNTMRRVSRYTVTDIEMLRYLRLFLDNEAGLGMPVARAKVLLGTPARWCAIPVIDVIRFTVSERQ